MKIKKRIHAHKETKNLEFFIDKNNDNSAYNAIYSLKKALNVIHQHHIRKKPILFVGVPFLLLKMYKRAAVNSNHFFIPKNCWVNGLLTNPSTCFYSLLSKKKTDKKLKFLINLSKKNSLVVLFDELNNAQALKESILKHTPVVSFDSTTSALSKNVSYPIKKGHLNSQAHNSCIHTVLLSILQKMPSEFLNVYAQNTSLYKSKNNFFLKNKNPSKKKVFKLSLIHI